MILNQKDLIKKLQNLKANNKKIILVTGFFDLFHIEHLAFLEKAKSVGDTLVVAIESDERARQKKGQGRPIFNQGDRVRLIDSLKVVDFTLALPDSFNSPEAYRNLIIDLSPEALAVSENSPHQQEKKKILDELGVELAVVYPHKKGISTTEILQKINKSLP